MRHMLLFSVLFLSLTACNPYTHWQLEKSRMEGEAEFANQRAMLARDFRLCLAHNAENPQRQRDCSVYNQARYQLDVSGLK